jgi:hypothetical protein
MGGWGQERDARVSDDAIDVIIDVGRYPPKINLENL